MPPPKCQILVIGIERGGVRLHERIDLAAHARVERVEAAATYILAYELLQIGVVLAVICLVLHQGIKEGRAGERVVDGIVHNTGSVIAAPHAAEGEVIIPRDEVQLSTGFIEVIVVDYARVENLTLQIYDCSLCIFFFFCKSSYQFLLFYILCNLKIFLLRFMLICFLILLFFKRRECAGLGDGRKNWSIPI